MHTGTLKDMLNLRVSRSNREITETIKSMYIDASPVMMWQNQNGRRVVSYATIQKIDFENNVILMQSNEKNRFEKFSKDFTIYIRGNTRSILFKQQQCRLNANKLAITIPSEVRLYEQRNIPRFNPSSKAEVEVHFEKKVGVGNGSDKNFSAKVINISQQGLCLEFMQHQSKFFYEEDSLKIIQLNNIVFDDKLSAQIVYVTKLKSGADRMRMGVKFDQELTQAQLAKIVKAYFLA